MVEGQENLAAVMAYCDDIGIRYQNPHTFFLDRKGLLRDPEIMKRFKADVDPKGLLNPGKFSDDDVSERG